jgi:RHS repeat-associated protein
MGFYATTTLPEKTAPLPKNRVGVFSASARTCAGRSASQVPEPHRENGPTLTETASGVRYYGYRFLSPETGRWLSRDPIGEGDGPNLVAFIVNNPVDNFDMLGLLLYTIRLDPPATPSKCRRVNWLIGSRAVDLNDRLWRHWLGGSGRSMTVHMTDFDSSGARSRHLDAALSQGCTEGRSLQNGQSGASSYRISNEQNWNYFQTPMIYGWRLTADCQVLYTKNCPPSGCSVDVMVNCQFSANDHVNFWRNIGQRFWIPGFPVDYSISDDLVRECNPGGSGFDVNASQTLQRSRSCSCN